MLLSFSGMAFSKQKDKTIDVDKLNKVLSNKGYPEEVLNWLEPQEKQELIDEGATYVTHWKDVGNLTDHEDKNIDIKSLSNFTHNFVISNVTSSTPGLLKRKVQYQWSWNYAPMFTLEDKFGIAWTDGWSVESNSWTYTASGLDPDGVRRSKTWSGSTLSDYQAGAGAAWKFDIVQQFPFYVNSTWGWRNIPVDRHSGKGTLYLAKYSNKSETWVRTSLSGKFFHQTVAYDGTVSFSASGPSLSISPSAYYDESSARTGYFDGIM